MTYKNANIEDIGSGIITGYGRQQNRFNAGIRQIIRNVLLLTIICLVLKKFSVSEIPAWYFTRTRPVDAASIGDLTTSLGINEPLSDFDDYNTVDVRRLILFLVGCAAVTVPFFF